VIPKNKGCFAENLAVCFLQEKNYFVFKGCQTQSAVDLVAVDPITFETRLFDVKAENKRKDGSSISRVPRIKNKNIEIIKVDLNTKKCRIVEKRKGVIWS
jgi:Holliday junction resolvase-like predicted endonuclease